MLNSIILLKYSFSLLLSLPLVFARKYDIDSESSRLYGEDFSTVLQKFRRSPDYLQILDEKYNEMLLFFGEVATYALQYTMDNRLKARVAEACGFEEATTTPEYYLKVRAKRRQDGGEVSTTVTESPVVQQTRNPIELLEKYVHYSNMLTTQERNNFRDLSFEVTGEMIHMIIKSMGPVDNGAEIRSTRLPQGGNPGNGGKTLRDEDHQHSISPTTDEPAENGGDAFY